MIIIHIIENTGNFTLNRSSSLVEILTEQYEFDYNNCTIEFNVINRTSVRVVITDKDGNVLYNQLTDENFVSPDLAASEDEYNITVYNIGNGTYYSSNATKLFKIMKVNSNITVYPIGNVTYGDSVVVEFTD